MPPPSTGSSPPPSSPVALPEAAKPAGKTWQAGTLTYTSAGVVVLFCWLLFGDFSWAMRDRSVFPMAKWYLKSLEVPNVLFGLLVTSFPALIGLFLGPVISMKSDRHRGRWGRRIPFLLVTTPLAAFGMVGLGVTPFIAKWVHGHFPEQSEMVVSVLCFGVFWAAFEFATIAGQVVFTGLINDVVPRPLLGRFFGLFRAVSLIDGVIFNYWIMGKVPDHFTLILVIVGVFYGASFMVVCLKVREGNYPPPPPVPVDERGRPVGAGTRIAGGMKTYARECFGSRYYLSVFVMLTFAGMAFLPVNTFSVPYAESLGMSMDFYGKCLAVTYAISFTLAYGIGWLVDRFHPLRVSMAAMAGYMLVALAGTLVATTPERFAVIYVLHGVLSGAYMTSAASLGLRLFPQSKFAQFASAAGVVYSLFMMTLGPAVGAVIDWTGNVYRHTFTVGCAVALVTLTAQVLVHRQFMRFGGPKGYAAPE
ncbi:MFS transporter [Opitutaceae bacterium TAV5]|nr:MFS transporter [Opitutaceae bacterium TAV5]